MDVRVLASAERGGNRVVLLEQRDTIERGTVSYTPPAPPPATPSLYIVTLIVHDRAQKPQGWARTDFEADVARELYDQAVSEFITLEPEPSFHGEVVE